MPLAVFAVLRALPLPRKVTGLLEAESGFNDAPAVILVLVFSAGASDLPDLAHVVGGVVYQLGVGGVLRLTIGALGAVGLRHIALPSTGLHPLATVGFGVVAFAAAGAAEASGFLAAYLSGLVLGNAKLPHRTATHSFAEGTGTRSFAEGTGWLAQIGLFVMLGSLFTPPPPRAALRDLVGRRGRTGPVAGGQARVRPGLPAAISLAVPAAGVRLMGRAAGRDSDRAGHLSHRRGRQRCP